MYSLLEDHIIANFCQLDGSSAYPGTLLVTEDKQYRSRGLTHIEDSAYEFFLKLEELRVGGLLAYLETTFKPCYENRHLRLL